MSLTVLTTIGLSLVSGCASLIIVNTGYWRESFIARLRIEAMDRHNEILEELLADPAITNATKDAVCQIGAECFEKDTALRFIDRLLALPTVSRSAAREAESAIVAEAISSALEVASTFAVQRIRIPEKKRLALIRYPGLAIMPAS